jgi:hypothetical protein
MPFRLVALVGAVAAAVALVVPVDVAAQTSAPPVTAWGAPDLQGVWDFRSLTPMERPRELKDKEVFTAEEAATFAERTVQRESRDQADTQAATAAGRIVPYNDFWFDWGSKVTARPMPQPNHDKVAWLAAL